MKTEFNLNSLDFEKICRICLLQCEHMQTLFSSGVFQYFMECGGTQAAPEDGLPQTVCSICMTNLQDLYLFKKKIEISDQTLRSMLSEKLNNSANIDHDISDRYENKPDVPLESMADHSENGNMYHVLCNCDANVPAIPPGKLTTAAEAHSDSIPNYYETKAVIVTQNLTCDENLCDDLSNLFQNTLESSTNSENGNSHTNDLRESKLEKPEFKSACTKRQKPKKHREMDDALAELMASAPNPMKKGQNNDCPDCTCHICWKKFSCKAQLTRHLKTHIGIRCHNCEVCGKAYMESGALRKHFLSKHTGRDQPFKCSECNQGFDIRSSLIRHVRTHTGEKPYVCEICHKLYSSQSYLNKHKEIHLDKREKSFICENCSKSFSSRDRLRSHQITHSTGRPHQCTLCGKAFLMKAYLRKHTKFIHTKERNFMCQTCGKTFVTKGELNEHMRKHTGQKKEPRHVCTVCDKKLSSSANLKQHIRSKHTGERPHHCEMCPKAFFTANALKLHRYNHTGERPFTCGYCRKGFVTAQCLEIHKRIHTGERPYICTLCNSSFTQSNALKMHMKVH